MSEYTEAFKYCKAHEKDIADAARNGDTNASAIITAYRMIVASPGDPGAAGVFIAAVEGYRAVKELDGD